MTKYLVIDVETVPLDLAVYFEEEEDTRTDHLNPIQSKIIAAGIRSGNRSEIFMGEDESHILTQFWEEWSAIRRGDRDIKIVGFNIAKFDMPMLTSRSFQNNVTVSPFLLKDLIDLRERISAFQWRPKGTLQDYAEAIGLTPNTGGGENVAFWYRDGDLDAIRAHLMEDLEVTDEVFRKAHELGITRIDKW